MANLWVRKSIAALKAEAAESDEHGLKRTLTATNLIMLGIGAVIGAGFFVLTGHAAAKNAGPADRPLVRPGRHRLRLRRASATPRWPRPCRSPGSAYTYAYATMGEFIAWLIGWDLILEYMVGATTVAIGWSGYVASFLHDRRHRHPAPVHLRRPGTQMIEVPDAIADKLHLRHGWSTLDSVPGAARRRASIDFSTLPPGHGRVQRPGDAHRRRWSRPCW